MSGYPLRVGLVSSWNVPFSVLVQRWKMAEELSFDSVWVTDHFTTSNDRGPDAEPIYEAWTSIAALAMVTERIRFGVMVSGNTYRNPALLTKQAVTVDHISNGRLELGIGAGTWAREHAAYGYVMPDPRERVGRFEEALAIIHGLQTSSRFDFQGTFYRVKDAPFEPKSLQAPRIPLVIGSFGPRMLAITAKHADMWNTRGTIDEVMPRFRLLDEECRKIGRQPQDIRRSIWPRPNPWSSVESVQQLIETYRVHGFSDFIFYWPGGGNEHVMREFARDVLPGMRV